MRSTILTFLIPSISALQLAAFYEPHYISNDANDTSSLEPPPFHNNELLKRDGGCPVQFNSCSTLNANYGGACCTVGSTCSIDGGRNVACCPIGALCTGSITAATATTTGGVIIGGATTSGITNTPATTTGAVPTITSAAGIVANPYFPFPIIQTTFANAAACSQAYSACQGNYAACTANLQGGAFGVTVVAPQGGVTVAPTAQNLGPAAATSICSSLSQAACMNLAEGNCAQYGGATTGGSFVVGGSANAAPRQTAGCVAAMGVMAGLGMGVVGRMNLLHITQSVIEVSFLLKLQRSISVHDVVPACSQLAPPETHRYYTGSALHRELEFKEGYQVCYDLLCHYSEK
ncbi:hypothetical protein GLAREA_02814 [Glarea lozoyensis ATCC 20868]|uniref:Uncharacterized protein n=1 Tax=Glarea lozoyensis (strain ATCC 20868 / MF5171) TaxID=1116229 RepID=S3CMF8_GLAL2|nr:uncharacterized protein GLAREA_02814 [Glarea lozoyensis ATCC 20868]EPE26900.1 hypothetical protein GLAREA_02814 [Glarea lozoyensis ATCC 20868]